eukprot:TRINITY_DN28121_c0_g1_i1.p1 TRINITY_DN28121_c0_g1~~TRINITY_DN28121_c0_g1_i1.p1  ORF type:complete len:349 (-),score=14.12 TRINITY_DN28121_c0_g1_i1:153-1199(-)
MANSEVELQRSHVVEYLKGLVVICLMFFLIAFQSRWGGMDHLRQVSRMIGILVASACCSLVFVMRSPDDRLSSSLYYVSRGLVLLRLIIQSVFVLYDDEGQSYFLKLMACFVLPASTSRDCPNLVLFLAYLVPFNVLMFLHLRRDGNEWMAFHVVAGICQPIWIEINSRISKGVVARDQLRNVLQNRHSLAEETIYQMLDVLCEGTLELDTNLRIKRLSSKMPNFLGCSEEDLLGHHFPGLLELASDMVAFTNVMDELAEKTKQFVSDQATSHAPQICSLQTKFRDRPSMRARTTNLFPVCMVGVGGETSYVVGVSKPIEDEGSGNLSGKFIPLSDSSAVLSKRRTQG